MSGRRVAPLLAVVAAAAILSAGAAPPVVAQQGDGSFVVLGHVRGEGDGALHGRLGELLEAVREIGPDFVILAGDNIWGDSEARRGPSDRDFVLRQWEELDSALAELRVPVYRVPGNHDIRDSVTYDIYRERYGDLPSVVDVGRTRLILLTTTWDPNRPDRARAVRGFGYHLDADQIEFLRARLAEHDRYDHAFVVMHHMLWWEGDDSPWWTEVHPVLAEAGVEAVFTGDYGPVKFSHTTHDGVAYFQSVIAGNPGLAIRQGHEWNRILAAQFDNFLVVTPGSGPPDIEVRTTGEISSGHFTREMWWDVHGGILRPPPPSGREHLAAMWGIPRARLFLLGAVGASGLAGLLLGWWVGRRRRA